MCFREEENAFGFLIINFSLMMWDLLAYLVGNVISLLLFFSPV